MTYEYGRIRTLAEKLRNSGVPGDLIDGIMAGPKRPDQSLSPIATAVAVMSGTIWKPRSDVN